MIDLEQIIEKLTIGKKETNIIECMWEDGITPKMVCEHYGYKYEITDEYGEGFWRKDMTPEWLKNIPEILNMLDFNKKIQVIFEYDPDYPRAYFRVKGIKDFIKK